MTNEFGWLRGKVHDFGDGATLKVVDVKRREQEEWVTFETQYPMAMPQRFSLKAREFLDKWGHLFQSP